MSPTPEQFEAANRRYIDEWVEQNPEHVRRILEHVQATERPPLTMTSSTTKERAMTSSPLTPLQQRRAQAVKDARAALVGGFGTVKTVSDIAVIAEYILNGIPAEKAAEKGEEKKPEPAHWPFYGAAPQRWYTGSPVGTPWARFIP